MTDQQQRKQAIRAYLQTWTLERLTAFECHLRDGKLVIFNVCKCLLGFDTDGGTEYLHRSCRDKLARKAEGCSYQIGVTDAARTRILLPLVRAEIRKRLRVPREQRVAMREMVKR